MKPFSKEELRVTAIILICVAVVTLLNLRVALRRSRDAKRRSDLGAISNALHSFFDDYGFFPPSEDGKILVCKGDDFNFSAVPRTLAFDRIEFFSNLRACTWGEDTLTDLGLFEEASTYLENLPEDPRSEDGVKYIYLSNTKRFQLYSTLEGESSEVGYDESILGRQLDCGGITCSYGKTYANTPLDRSIEEYEKQLEELRKAGAGSD